MWTRDFAEVTERKGHILAIVKEEAARSGNRLNAVSEFVLSAFILHPCHKTTLFRTGLVTAQFWSNFSL